MQRAFLRLCLVLLVSGGLGACASHPSVSGNASTPASLDEAQSQELHRALDAYIDLRFEADSEATSRLVEMAETMGANVLNIETLLRKGRNEYPAVEAARLGKAEVVDVDCYHVDYSTKFHLYIPSSYDPSVATPVMLIGHGGNSSMSAQRALDTAESYLSAYEHVLAEEHGAIAIAPASERGWGHIGNSILFSALSRVQRDFHVDPDRIYVLGQSMGGHLAYRAALSHGDRFAAFSPQSGGYAKYIESGAIQNLFTESGYVTFGASEPYDLNETNLALGAWLGDRSYDWVFREKSGGHEIYADEMPAISTFFRERQRDMYRDHVFYTAGGSMLFTKTWEIDGWPEHQINLDRPMRWNQRYWLEMTSRVGDDEAPTLLTMDGEIQEGNRIAIQSDGVRQMRVWLHASMVNLQEKVVIEVNGEVLHDAVVPHAMAQMLELVREFDDRGRVYHAYVDLAITTDKSVPTPAP